MYEEVIASRDKLVKRQNSVKYNELLNARKLCLKNVCNLF